MDIVKTNINTFFGKKEPWQIATITATSTLLAVWIYQYLMDERSKFADKKL